MMKIEGIKTPMPTDTIVDTRTGRPISFDQLIGQLAEVRVVYVGERHTDMAQHRIQLKIIQALVDRGRDIGSAWRCSTIPTSTFWICGRPAI